MNRLLQARSARASPVIAVRAMLQVIDGPGSRTARATEVLAQQHYRSITAMLGRWPRRAGSAAPSSATRITC